jgi:hypothetical protein
MTDAVRHLDAGIRPALTNFHFASIEDFNIERDTSPVHQGTNAFILQVAP